MISAGPKKSEKYAWKTQKIDILDGPGVPAIQQSVDQRKN